MILVMDYFTTTELAARMKVKRQTVVLWIKAGKVAATRTPGLRGQYRIPAAEAERLEQLIAPQQVA